MRLLRALGVVVGLVVFPLMAFADTWTGFYGELHLEAASPILIGRRSVCSRYSFLVRRVMRFLLPGFQPRIRPI